MVLDALNQQIYILLGDGHGSFNVVGTINSILDPVTVLDVNGDGKPDLLLDTGPSVMLGNGNGTFVPPSSYSQTFDYDNVCTYADMDGDGHVDAVCGYLETITGDITGATHLIILHGNPDGSFNPTPISDKVFGNHNTQYDGMGSFQFPITVSDLNDDGIPDIIAYSGDGYTVLLGQPGLKFSDPKHYVAGPASVSGTITQQIVDINNDGHLDIVTAGTNGVYISYGKPDGTFDTAPAYEVAQVLGHATFADFNGDGVPDIVATGDTQLQLSLGNGDGTFAPYQPLPKGALPFISTESLTLDYIAHGDFNGDGKQDIIAAGFTSSYEAFPNILFGHGDGTFDPPLQIPDPAPSLPELVADVNGDRRDDLISNVFTLAEGSPGLGIRVSLSNGDGTFRSVNTEIPTEIQPNGLSSSYSTPALADFDSDGKLDLVLGAVTNVYVFNGHGDGSFDSNPATTLPIPVLAGTQQIGTAAVTTGDFDGDSKKDIAVLYIISYAQNEHPANRAVFVYYGNGDGTFSAPVTAGIFAHNHSTIVASDLNGDGRADLILLESGLYERPALAIVHSMAGRSFGPEVNYLGGNGLVDLAVLDVNRDGRPDILVSNGNSSGFSGSTIANAVAVLLNQTDVPVVSGTLTSSPKPSAIGQPFTLTATLAPPSPSTLTGNVQFTIDGIDAGSASLSSNAATITAPATLSIGTHTLSATWLGNSAYPPITLSAIHTIVGVPVNISFTASPNPATVGQLVTLTESVTNINSADPAPTGSITITDNGTAIANSSSQLSNTYQHGFIPGGNHTFTLAYSGDANHSPASKSIILTVNSIASATTLATSVPIPLLTANPSPSPPASATPSTPNTTRSSLQEPSPSPAFPEVLAHLPVPSTMITGNTNTVNYTISTLPPGTYTVTAAFSGNASLAPSTSTSLTQIINAASTTTTLSANPNPAYATQTVTLSAHVAAAPDTPTGTIQFLDGATPLTTASLVSGNATFATALLAPGAHSITALYSGDANNLPSTSSPFFIETILPSDFFALSIDPSSLTLITGHHTTLTLTATSIGNFADTIHLSIGLLPQWTTVTFTPVTLQLSANGTATTRVYVDTDAVVGYISQTQPKRNPSTPFPTALATTLALLLLPFTNRRARRLPALIALAITATLLIGATGCSGMYPGSTAPGTYNLQITATGTQTPITHTLTLPLTVTK